MQDKIKIIDERCTGKTTRAISLCLEYDALLVCNVPDYAKLAWSRIGDEKIAAISYQDYLNNIDRYNNKKIFIDDIDKFVEELTHGNYIGFTCSKEPQCFKYKWCQT